jgi:hypothetical protein
MFIWVSRNTGTLLSFCVGFLHIKTINFVYLCNVLYDPKDGVV